MKLSFLSLGLAVALVACGSQQMPTARVASSEAAVRAAHEVGASQIPEASLHLRMAEDQLKTANRLIKDGEPEKAEWLLVRSQADAELAIGLTRESKAKAGADQAQQKLQSVQQAPHGQPHTQPTTPQP